MVSKRGIGECLTTPELEKKLGLVAGKGETSKSTGSYGGMDKLIEEKSFLHPRT